ncbi:MAG TPA: hypothetical protein VI146_07650 [Nitrososphaeraceae archaeon]
MGKEIAIVSTIVITELLNSFIPITSGVDCILNIAYIESPLYIEAKACGCKEKGITIVYSFVDSYHSLCLDRKDIMLGQLDACERLLKYAIDEMDKKAIIKEIAELKMTLDLLP